MAAKRERWHSNTPWRTWVPEAYTCPVGSLSPERVVSALALRVNKLHWMAARLALKMRLVGVALLSR